MRKAKVKDARPKKIFMVWDDADPDCKFFSQFDTLDEAVNESGGSEIYQAIPKPIGKFKKVTTLVKIEEKRGPGRPKGAK